MTAGRTKPNAGTQQALELFGRPVLESRKAISAHTD